MRPSTERHSAVGAVSAAQADVAFERFAGVSAIVTGLSSLLYAVFFLLVSGPLHEYLPSFFLALGGLLATPVLAALYQRVSGAALTFALWAFGLGFIGQVGTSIHGVFGLASLIGHMSTASSGATGPNPVDPAGFLAFGLTGLSTLVFAWLILRDRQLPAGLGYLGIVLAVALVALFLGALLTYNPKSLFILVPGGLASLLATPIWNIWLGAIFLARRSA